MNKVAIVVIGYNRLNPIKRLINSLTCASYNNKVDLIISIDKSDSTIVEEFAKTVEWKYGNIIIKTFSNNLGLKQHVLTCGNYLNEYNYDAIIVLEDDIIVSPGFYNFAIQAIEKYKNNDKIAGISLYHHAWNLFANRPFIPLKDKYDAFFLKYAQSWGQIWLKKQWNEFYNWYIKKQYELLNKNEIPKNVLEWDEKSWLKYHIQYCIDTNKYFVYPYISFTSNFCDSGIHNKSNSTRMQVPLDMGTNKEYNLPDFNEDALYYDAYFESENIYKLLNIKKEDLIVDFYSCKCFFLTAKYLLSTRQLNYKIIKKYALEMKPYELNIKNNIYGNEIFLYDLTEKEKNVFDKNNWFKIFNYDFKGEFITGKMFKKIFKYKLFNKIKK